MVIQQTIDNLRDRPKHERRAVASATALGVMGVLFLGWIVYFVRTVQTEPIAFPAQQATDAVQQVKDTYGNAVQTASVGATQDATGTGVQPDASVQSIDIPNDTTNF